MRSKPISFSIVPRQTEQGREGGRGACVVPLGKGNRSVWHIRTLFADERVIPVVRVVRVAKSSMRIFEFEELVAMLAGMTRAFGFVDDGERGKICGCLVSSEVGTKRKRIKAY